MRSVTSAARRSRNNRPRKFCKPSWPREGTKAILLAPLVRVAKADTKTSLPRSDSRLVRARVDGEIYDLDNVPELSKQKNHTIDAVVDRVSSKNRKRTRLAESINLTLKLSDGLLTLLYLDAQATNTNPESWHEQIYNTEYACPTCKLSYEEIQPRTFSFIAPTVRVASAMGSALVRRSIPISSFRRESLVCQGSDRAVAHLGRDARCAQEEAARTVFEGQQSSARPPLADWKPKPRSQLLFGDGKGFPGLIAILDEELATAKNDDHRAHLEAFRAHTRCNGLRGFAAAARGASVKVGGRYIHEIVA